MRSSKELFPLAKEGRYGFEHCPSYSDIVDVFGEVLLQVHDSDYQGDSRILYRRNTDTGPQYGTLTFGWGSCSGCDALQDCSTFSDLDDLVNRLEEGIFWYASVEETILDLQTRDWRGSYGGNEGVEFAEKAIEALTTLQQNKAA